MEKLDIPQSVFHRIVDPKHPERRIEDPEHPGEYKTEPNYIYPGVFYIATKQGPTYYIRYRSPDNTPRFEKAGPEATTAALAADIRRDRIRGKELPNSVRRAAVEAEKKTSVTFAEYSAEWLSRKNPKLSRSTYRNYVSMLKVHISPIIGNIPIVKMNYRDIDDMVARMNGVNTRKNTALILIGGIFDEAILRGDAESNPTARVKRLREEKTDIDPMSYPEVKQFLSAVPVHYKAYFATAFLTGARPSELFALKRLHVDFKLRCISIREGMVRGEIGKLKTVTSRRDVDILPPLHPVLSSHIDSLPEDATQLVFTTPSGGHMDLTNLRNWIWYPFLERAGLRRRTMYQTRHTFASLMLSAGEDPQWVSRQLGHADTSIMFSHYAKFIRNRDRIDGRKFVTEYENAATYQLTT